MDNSSDDTKLASFLRQHRSIAPVDSGELEAQIMVQIDLLPASNQPQISRMWLWRIGGGIGIAIAGILGMTIHQMMNPPQLNVAELDRLDHYLIDRSNHYVIEPTKIDDPDNLDAFLLQDDDAEDI